MASLELAEEVARAGRIGRRFMAAVNWDKHLNCKRGDEETLID